MKNVSHIISFVSAKQLLESMQSLITRQQGNFGFSETGDKIHIYEETIENADDWMSYLNQYTPELLARLTKLLLKRNDHNHVDIR